MNFPIENPPQTAVETSDKLSFSHTKEAEVEALALACELLDQLNLDWDVPEENLAGAKPTTPQTNIQSPTFESSQENKDDTEDDALALACELLDQLELDWNE